MKIGSMKLTQGLDGGGRGKQKQIYIKPELESKLWNIVRLTTLAFLISLRKL